MKYNIFLVLFVFILCSSPFKKQANYINYLNSKNFSSKIKKTFDYIPRINSIVYYDFIEFNKPHIIYYSPKNYKYMKSDFKTSSGSSIIVYNDDNKLLLLTCAHIVYFPDTVYLKNKSNLVTGIIIKKKQNIYVSNMSNQIDIVAIDTFLDIALLGVKLKQDMNTSFFSITLKKGNSDLLKWGDNIFILGYPKGLQALNQGIVSFPYKNKNYILTNALFNKGLSGAPVFAINNETLDFELMGIAKSTLADFDYVLRPNKDSIITVDEKIVYPYYGNSYITKLEIINYGLTQIIPINLIYNKFFKENKSKIENYGCNFNLLFK